MPEIIAIAAVAANGVIGAGNDIPWRIPADWQRFKALTMGSVLIMGRKTYDSIGRPLPGRTIFVITRDRMWRGEEYARYLLWTRRSTRRWSWIRRRSSWPVEVRSTEPPGIGSPGLEITEVAQNPVGEVTFPTIDPDDWIETAREPRDGYLRQLSQIAPKSTV